MDQFFVLSSRGDPLVTKTYKKDFPRGCADMYFRRIKFGKNENTGDVINNNFPPPVFQHENLFNFVHVQRNGLFFVAVVDLSYPVPYTILYWLNLFARTTQDFLGSLCEDSLRDNIVLVYEILDESVDPSGVLKTTDPAHLKSKVYSDVASQSTDSSSAPIQILNSAADALSSAVSNSGLDLTAMSDSFKKSFESIVSPKQLPANASHRPIMNVESRNEIFLDLIENINTIINPDGTPQCLVITGNMLIKAFLSMTKPMKFKIVLSDGLQIGKHDNNMIQGLGGLYRPTATNSQEVILDHAVFDTCVDIKDLKSSKTLYVQPREGERTLMSYRVCNENVHANHANTLPFTFKSDVKAIRSNYVEANIKLRPNSSVIKSGAAALLAVIPIPPELIGISCSSSFSDQRTNKIYTTVAQRDAGNAWDDATTRISICDYERDSNRIVWKIPKLNANECVTLKIQIDIPSEADGRQFKVLLSRIGPMKLYFDLPNYTASRLQIKLLRVIDAITGKEMNNGRDEIFDNNISSISSTRISNGEQDGLGTGLKNYRWVRYLSKGTSYICNLGLG